MKSQNKKLKQRIAALESTSQSTDEGNSSSDEDEPKEKKVKFNQRSTGKSNKKI